MAHFAEINENNIVTRVIVVSDDLESNGSTWCSQTFGGTWIQTSYNGRIRKNFAGIGYTYDVTRDAFIPPKPYFSWLLNNDSCLWESPIPYPIDGKTYIWDEETQQWVER